MKKSLLFAMLALFSATMMTSCGNKAANAESVEDDAVALSVDSLMANPDAFVGQEVTVEGVVSHLCAHGGRKAFLVGSTDGTLIRCDATPDMGGVFPQECTHHAMLVTGVMTEERIGEEEVQAMEQQRAARQAEIAKEQGAEAAAQVAESVGGCDTERKAAGQGDIDKFSAQMADYRARIAERNEKEGKPYLSFYCIKATAYEVLPE